MKAILPIVVSFLLTLSAVAHTSVEGKFTCPIDGRKFKQYVDASGTQFGLRLDYKPLGAIAAPWAIPQCPKCKFVLYEESFDTAIVQKIKPFILSERYRSAAAGNSSYFCLALVREFLGSDALDIGYAYLQASWQVESNPAKCREYLRLAHDKLAAGLKTLKPTDVRFADVALVCGELERRLGRFTEAEKRFNALRTMKAFKDAQRQKIIARQLYFISKEDAAPHALDKEQEKLL